MTSLQSQYNPFLTLDNIVNQPENKLFDRKSAKIKVADLASIISAFANAKWGIIKEALMSDCKCL